MEERSKKFFEYLTVLRRDVSNWQEVDAFIRDEINAELFSKMNLNDLATFYLQLLNFPPVDPPTVSNSMVRDVAALLWREIVKRTTESRKAFQLFVKALEAAAGTNRQIVEFYFRIMEIPFDCVGARFLYFGRYSTNAVCYHTGTIERVRVENFRCLITLRRLEPTASVAKYVCDFDLNPREWHLENQKNLGIIEIIR